MFSRVGSFGGWVLGCRVESFEFRGVWFGIRDLNFKF